MDMFSNPRRVVVLLFGIVIGLPNHAETPRGLAETPRLDHNVVSSETTYRGRSALRVLEHEVSNTEDKLVILTESAMRNGSISGYVAGARREDAVAQARGFVGIAFRIDDAIDAFEAVYLRPTNARADDQLRRNHSVQYVSFPDYPWHRLRRETPGKYETYADMVPGEWIHYRLEVDESSARLYLNEAEQPTLVVNDLKLEPRTGRVGLWIGPGTLAHFSSIRVEPR